MKADLNIVADNEDVARLLFSPLFICDGILSQKAFTLDKELTFLFYALQLVVSMRILKASKKKVISYTAMHS